MALDTSLLSDVTFLISAYHETGVLFLNFTLLISFALQEKISLKHLLVVRFLHLLPTTHILEGVQCPFQGLLPYNSTVSHKCPFTHGLMNSHHTSRCTSSKSPRDSSYSFRITSFLIDFFIRRVSRWLTSAPIFETFTIKPPFSHSTLSVAIDNGFFSSSCVSFSSNGRWTSLSLTFAGCTEMRRSSWIGSPSSTVDSYAAKTICSRENIVS